MKIQTPSFPPELYTNVLFSPFFLSPWRVVWLLFSTFGHGCLSFHTLPHKKHTHMMVVLRPVEPNHHPSVPFRPFQTSTIHPFAHVWLLRESGTGWAENEDDVDEFNGRIVLSDSESNGILK